MAGKTIYPTTGRPACRYGCPNPRPQRPGIVEDLDRRGVGLVMLFMGGQQIDVRGKLMLTMLAAIAEFEHGLLLERQKEGVCSRSAAATWKARSSSRATSSCSVSVPLPASATSSSSRALMRGSRSVSMRR